MTKRILIGVMLILALVFLMGCSNQKPIEENIPTPPNNPSPSEEENPSQEEDTIYEIEDFVTKDVLINSSMKYMMNQIHNTSTFQYETTKYVIDVTDYGVVADDISQAEYNLNVINYILQKAEDSTELFFPKGTYYLYGTGISILGKKNITIRGDEVIFINTSYDATNGMSTKYYSLSRMFHIENSEHIQIEGITIDYYHHTCADGTILKVQGGYTYLKVFDEFISGSKPALSGGEYVFCVNLFDSSFVPTNEYYISENGYLLEKVEEENNLFRLKGEYGSKGTIASFRFTSGTYASPVYYITNNDGVVIRNCKQRTSPSATFYAPSGNQNFLFDHFSVEVEENSQQLFASNVDCIHVKGLQGELILSNCRFVGIGDDALNVHSKIAQVSSVSENVVTLKEHISRFAKPGDIIGFYTEDYQLIHRSIFISSNNDNTEFTLSDVPNNISDKTLLINESNNPVTLIENCFVKRSRARGFLIQTKNCLIQNCSFEDIRLAAILISPDLDYWFEGGAADNILIQNCSFKHVGTASSMQRFGAILINGCHDLKKFPLSKNNIHKNVSVVHCDFQQIRYIYAIYCNSIANIQVKDNITDDSELGFLKT